MLEIRRRERRKQTFETIWDSKGKVSQAALNKLSAFIKNQPRRKFVLIHKTKIKGGFRCQLIDSNL